MINTMHETHQAMRLQFYDCWQEALFAKFRLFGLPNGLGETELRTMHVEGFTPDQAYNVACDIYAGFGLQKLKKPTKPTDFPLCPVVR